MIDQTAHWCKVVLISKSSKTSELAITNEYNNCSSGQKLSRLPRKHFGKLSSQARSRLVMK